MILLFMIKSVHESTCVDFDIGSVTRGFTIMNAKTKLFEISCRKAVDSEKISIREFVELTHPEQEIGVNQVFSAFQIYIESAGKKLTADDFQKEFPEVEIPEGLSLLSYVKNNASDFWVERYLS